MLDIGPGYIDVAYPISQSVERYVAVERNPEAAHAIRNAGLVVVDGVFPEVAGSLGDAQFDLVVSSHSIPESDWSSYEPFLEAAWAKVAPGGSFVVITFKGDTESPMMRLRGELLKRQPTPDRRYIAMHDWLSRRGRVDVSKETSFVMTASISDLEVFFGPLLWKTVDEQRARSPRLCEVADRFLEGGRYRIPTEHLLIATKRAA
jgi:hypothetical protein